MPKRKISKKKFITEYLEMLKEIRRKGPVFTAKNHPEWATRAKVEKWLRESRMADERNFDVFPKNSTI